MNEKSAEITRRYLGGKTLASFADSLGVGAKKQSVFQWKTGKHMPDTFTLLQVINSPKATSDAIAWAEEIMSLYLERG